MTVNHPSFGKLDDNHIIMFDTTLRDGEQSPGFSMNIEEKLRMAEALKELGVDVLEAGFAIASPGDFESVQAISKHFSKDGPVIASLSRAAPADILRSAEALRPAARRRIHIVLATSDLHMRVKLRMSRDEVLEATTRSVELARQHADDVEWSAEDGSRSDPDFLCRCAEAAIRAGATTINIPDTVGYAMPEDMERIFADLRARVPGDRGRGPLRPQPQRPRHGGRQHHRGDPRRRAAGARPPSTASASGPAMPASKRWRWPSAPAATRCPTAPTSRRGTSCGPAGCSPPSPASTCSRTRRSSAATPSRTNRASTRTAC